MFLPGMIATFIGQTWRRYPQTTLCTSVASMIKRLTKDDSTLALTVRNYYYYYNYYYYFHCGGIIACHMLNAG
jgi:hypothetical protein